MFYVALLSLILAYSTHIGLKSQLRPFFAQIGPKGDLKWLGRISKRYFLYSKAKFILNASDCVEKWTHLAFLAILSIFGPTLAKIRTKTPKNDPKSQISIFLSKIYTQYLRLCGKVALFGSLSLLEHFWQKIGPKMRPKMARKDL